MPFKNIKPYYRKLKLRKGILYPDSPTLLTPLYIKALNASQAVSDTFCPHRSIIFWDATSHKFKRETRKRHLWPWHFTNYGLIGCCQIFCLATYLFQCRSNTTRMSLVEGMAACLQFLHAVVYLIVAHVSLHSITDLISFLNEIVVFEGIMNKKYSKKKSQVKLDALGILANIVVHGFGGASFHAPCIFLALKVDAAILPFKQILIALPLELKILFHVIRSAITISCFVETLQWSRILSIVAILYFRGLKSCHDFLFSQPVSETIILQDLRQLHILFASVREFSSIMFFLCLSLVYGQLLIFATVVVLVIASGPRILTALFGILWLVVGLWMMFLLDLVVSVDSISGNLKARWMHSCSLLQNKHVQMKFIYRILTTIKPIGIPYWSLGTFTRNTRTDYLYSIGNNCITAILAFG